MRYVSFSKKNAIVVVMNTFNNVIEEVGKDIPITNGLMLY